MPNSLMIATPSCEEMSCDSARQTLIQEMGNGIVNASSSSGDPYLFESLPAHERQRQPGKNDQERVLDNDVKSAELSEK